MLSFVAQIGVLVGLALLPMTQAAAASLDGIDAVVARAMDRWEVPGLAVSAIRDGRVVLHKTYGLRDVIDRIPVTPETLFAVGSIAKSFTVAGLAMLKNEGRLDLDAPARNYLPGLRLRRVAGARAVTIRDMLTHRTGLPRHDALWYFNAYSRGELIRRLGFLPPFGPPGEEFQYSNLMVMVAGRTIGAVSGGTWEAFTRGRILAPLGMTATRLGLAGFLATPDRASGYFPAADGRIPIRPRDTDAVGPAASVYSNLSDMTRWLRYLLAAGPVAGSMTAPRIGIPDAPAHPELGLESYGMGLYLGRYRGRMLARHPGVIDGYAALISMMPGEGIGVVALTNMSGGNPVPAIVSYAIYDRLLGLPPVDWAARFPSAAERRAARRPTTAAPTAATSPDRPLSDYAGNYDHPAYGRIRIDRADRTGLAGRMHGLTFRLYHAGGDNWRLDETRWPLREGLVFRFVAGEDGRVLRLATPLADGPTYRRNPGELFFERAGKAP